MPRPAARLRAVPAAPTIEPEPSLAYEYEERRRIAAKDWAAIHVRGDRSRPLDFFQRVVRPWR
jgi:hypothetical protein